MLKGDLGIGIRCHITGEDVSCMGHDEGPEAGLSRFLAERKAFCRLSRRVASVAG
jgi:hypothetical protein